LPPAARGLFLRKPPPGPLQKLFIDLFGCGDADHLNSLSIGIHHIVFLLLKNMVFMEEWKE
jgi:hypothetical protein